MDEKDLDNISKKLFENYRLQRPPENFTDKLMMRIGEAKNTVKQEKPVFGKKFILLFVITFSTLISFGYIFKDKNTANEESFWDKMKIPGFNVEETMKLFNFNLEIGLFAKLIIASIIVLIVIDLLTGSVIDYFLDSKAKAKDQI